MAIIRIAGFTGENRALHPSLLAEHQATVSRNQRPGRGDLRSWNAPQTIATVPAGRSSMYRMGRDVASDAQYWLSWPSVVHAVRGFDPGDTTERTYYSGDGAPKVTDNLMGLASAPSPISNFPIASRPLGLPAPSSPLTVTTLQGGTGDLVSSYYVYTYVNDWGWESAPSPVSTESNRPSDAQATLAGFTLPPSGNYGINRLRIYRTATGSSGATDFYFLREIALGTQSTIDDLRDLGEVCPTVSWAMPPDDLTQLTALWNGMLAGISGNRIRFCEPYVAYAWPQSYDLIPPDSKPVALGVFGQQLVVLTNGRPLIVSGSSPDAMDQQLIDLPQACVAPRSVVSMGSGVSWASEDGLCWIGQGGARLLTAGIMTRADWQALKPATIIGAYYEGLYLGSFDDGSGRRGFLIDPASTSGIYLFDASFTALHVDPLQDQLYGLSGANIQRFDGSTTPLTYRFRSKVFRAPQPINFSGLEVQADAYPVTVKVDALDLSSSTVTSVSQRLGARVSAPSATSLRYTVSVTGPEAQRLPAGFLAQQWQIELEGTSPVQSVALATSVEELAQV
jgi:hypothetical protein